jgi:hypothetical protein
LVGVGPHHRCRQEGERGPAGARDLALVGPAPHDPEEALDIVQVQWPLLDRQRGSRRRRPDLTEVVEIGPAREILIDPVETVLGDGEVDDVGLDDPGIARTRGLHQPQSSHLVADHVGLAGWRHCQEGDGAHWRS